MSKDEQVVRSLAEKIAAVVQRNGGLVVTPQMKKEFGDQLVVATKNNIAIIINGGHHVGAKDGQSMPADEFQKKIPCGVTCLWNPRADKAGNVDLGRRVGGR